MEKGNRRMILNEKKGRTVGWGKTEGREDDRERIVDEVQKKEI